ncbi:PTS sugar transporter subunit IIA [Enterocloster citroniae]|nr:PTS sugar transporter subunit IIA [Enterocloster citroniae]
MTEDCIEINQLEQTWEGAIRCAGEILKRKGCVTSGYVEQMVEVVRENGPYIIVDEGVALAHARPSDGVKKIGMSLAVLKRPAYFEGIDKPVVLMFGLSAVDSDSHIELLSELSLLLKEEDLKEQINGCITEAQVIKYINFVLTKKQSGGGN